MDIQENKLKILNITKDYILPYKYKLLLKKFTQKICDLLEKNNIEYWCYGGAVIGQLRYNGMLPWDDDIDICILKETIDKLKSLKQVFENNNIKLFEGEYAFKIYDLNGFKIDDEYYPFIDVFKMKNFNNKIVHIESSYFRLKWANHFFLYDNLYPLQKLDFEDYQLYFANNIVDYVDRGYEKWKDFIVVSNIHIKSKLENKDIPDHKFNIIHIDETKQNDCKYIWSFNYFECSIPIKIIILDKENINKYLPNLKLIDNILENFDENIKNDIIKYLILYHYGGIFINNKINSVDKKIIDLLEELKKYDYITINNDVIISRQYSNLFTVFLDELFEKILNKQPFNIHLSFDDVLKDFVKNQDYIYLSLS